MCGKVASEILGVMLEFGGRNVELLCNNLGESGENEDNRSGITSSYEII